MTPRNGGKREKSRITQFKIFLEAKKQKLYSKNTLRQSHKQKENKKVSKRKTETWGDVKRNSNTTNATANI